MLRSTRLLCKQARRGEEQEVSTRVLTLDASIEASKIISTFFLRPPLPEGEGWGEGCFIISKSNLK